MRKKLVVANWKMNGSLVSNAGLLAGMKSGLDCFDRVDLVLCPPYPYIWQVMDALRGTGIDCGAQNLSSFTDGAYTGEVSASMLADLGCRWVIIGHSERRASFGDTDDLVAAKVISALDAGLTPILCVGESLAQRTDGVAEAVVRSQLDSVLTEVGRLHGRSIVVAYEPIWAIGTGNTASPDQAERMHSFIRSHLRSLDGGFAESRVIYGGSVNSANAATLFACPSIDGALVGGASLVVDSFASICAAAAAC